MRKEHPERQAGAETRIGLRWAGMAGRTELSTAGTAAAAGTARQPEACLHDQDRALGVPR